MADSRDKSRRPDAGDGFRLLSPGTIALPQRPGTRRPEVRRTELRRTDLLRPVLDDLPAWLKVRCHMELAGRDETDDGVVVVYPGSSLRVYTAIEFIEPTTLKWARIGLRFTATGSGSPETHEFVRRTFAEGPLEAGQIVEHDVVMRVPDSAPMSYEGVYVKILWFIVLEFAEPEGHIHEESVPILIKPRPVAWRADAARDEDEDEDEDEAEKAARERAESEVADPADPDDIEQPAEPDEPVPMGDERAPAELVEAEADEELVDQPDPAGENIDADEEPPEDGEVVAAGDEDVGADTLIELVEEPSTAADVDDVDELDTRPVDGPPAALVEAEARDTEEDVEAPDDTVEVPDAAVGGGPVRSFYGDDDDEPEPHLRDFYMGSDKIADEPARTIRVSDAGSVQDTRKPSGESSKDAAPEARKKPTKPTE